MGDDEVYDLDVDGDYWWIMVDGDYMVIWMVDIFLDGEYDVYVIWLVDDKYVESVCYMVYYDDGIEDVDVNQC